MGLASILPNRSQTLSLSQPSSGNLGVSLRRSSSQFNIRPWQPALLGNPLLQLGLPRRNDSLWTRAAPAALAEKRLGFAPTASDQTTGWDESRYVVTAFPKTSRFRQCSRLPSTSTRARGRWRRWPCPCGRRARASLPACRRALSRLWPRIFSPQGPGPVPWQGPSSAASSQGSATLTRRAPAAGACCRPW